MIDKLYQLTHDIDWFCIINGRPIHVASNGGMLPDCIKSRKQLFAMQSFVEQLPEISADNVVPSDSEVIKGILRNDYDNIEGENNDAVKRETYYRSFLEMARKGFYSYDRLSTNQEGQNEETSERYFLVASPGNPLELNDQNETFFPILKDVDFNFENEGMINLVELINQNY